MLVKFTRNGGPVLIETTQIASVHELLRVLGDEPNQPDKNKAVFKMSDGREVEVDQTMTHAMELLGVL
jgi:hypothetical protein